jgi:hypothetical protein
MVQLSKLASFVVRKISHYHFLLWFCLFGWRL